MKKHDATLVHRTRDEFGAIEVVRERQVLSLHFGTPSRQSSMDPDDPSRLVLSYTRAMLACLLFDPAPRSALLIGLGGGSLVRFLVRHFPDCRITVLENRPAVVELARQFFLLPDDLELVIADGARYVRETRARFDLLLVDAYDAQGLSPSLFSPDFFASCRRILTPQGWLSINLWGGIATPLQQIEQNFPYLLRLSVRDRGNLIVLASPSPPARELTTAARERADQLQHRLGLEFPNFLKDLLPGRCEPSGPPID